MVYWEAVLPSTLKVSKFRASVLLIGDLSEVSTAPLQWTHARTQARTHMRPAFYHQLPSAAQAAFTAGQRWRVGALFKRWRVIHRRDDADSSQCLLGKLWRHTLCGMQRRRCRPTDGRAHNVPIRLMDVSDRIFSHASYIEQQLATWATWARANTHLSKPFV